MNRKEEYLVIGMTCASCSSSIEKALSKKEGVTYVSANINTNKLLVEYDDKKINIDIIEKVVDDLGYQLEELDLVKEVEILIEGMTCASCTSNIENTLRKNKAIEYVSVNLITKNALIKYNQKEIKLSEIKSIIKDLGYEPLSITNVNVDIQRAEKKLKEKKLKIEFLVSLVFGILLLYLAMSHMFKLPLPEFIDMGPHPKRFALSQALLLLPIVYCGRRFFKNGFKALFKRHPNMDSLIAVGTSAAIVYSAYETYKILTGANHGEFNLYYETAGIILTLIMLGKGLEERSKGRTSEAIKTLMDLKPKKARVKTSSGIVEVGIDEVEKGNIVIIKPGENISVDGVIVSGNGFIDESMLTGESIPVKKKSGEMVYSGTLNTNGSMEVKCLYEGTDTALSKIIKLVEDAQGIKAPIAKIADNVSAYFVPIVMVIAIVSGIIWYFAQSFEFALSIFISVLVIACPCALGLATPTAIMVGTGKGASKGILFKSGEALETTHNLDVIVFDKTGTITEGKPKVVSIMELSNISEEKILSICASIEKQSEHPLGKAIYEEGQNRNLKELEVKEFNNIIGKGIVSIIEGNQEVLIGNLKLMLEFKIKMDEDNIKKADTLGHDGITPMYVALNKELIGIIGVADKIKDSSISAVQELKSLGLRVIMLTGDNKTTGMAIGKQVGIDEVKSEVHPEDKSNEIKKLQEEGLKVAMVGDGINDAPAIAIADIGISIGSGTDIAMETSDIVLMKSNLQDIGNAINLSNKTIRNIKQNLFWAFIYNTLGIPLAAGVFYALGFENTLLNPIFAAGAMSLSSISVVANALRLKRVRI